MTDGSEMATASDPPAIRSELLCFICQKSKIMTFDDIAKLCTDFYREDEIIAAKVSAEQLLPSRLPKRQGPNKCRATVEDLIKCCTDPNVKMPTYYAVDLSRLPPVSSDHCDVSAILAELQYLRSEVRAVAHISEEVQVLRQEILQLRQLRQEIDDMRTDVAKLSIQEFPPLPMPTDGTPISHVLTVPKTTVKFANRAKELQNGGMSSSPELSKMYRKPRKPVFGKAVNSKVKSVQTFRTIDVFISRLHPETKTAEIVDCVREIDSTIQDIDCTKLKSRYESLYSSFHVAIKVDTAKFQSALEQFMLPESWPSGSLVKRYFKPKNGLQQ